MSPLADWAANEDMLDSRLWRNASTFSSISSSATLCEACQHYISMQANNTTLAQSTARRSISRRTRRAQGGSRLRREDLLLIFKLDTQLKTFDFYEPLLLVFQNSDVRFTVLRWLERVEFGGALGRRLVRPQVRQVALNIAVRATANLISYVRELKVQITRYLPATWSRKSDTVVHRGVKSSSRSHRFRPPRPTLSPDSTTPTRLFIQNGLTRAFP